MSSISFSFFSFPLRPIYIYIFFFLSCKPFCSLHESLNSKPNSSFSDHPDTSTQHRHTRPYLKPTSKLIGYSQGCLLLKYLSLCTSVVFYKLIFFNFFFSSRHSSRTPGKRWTKYGVKSPFGFGVEHAKVTCWL